MSNAAMGQLGLCNIGDPMSFFGSPSPNIIYTFPAVQAIVVYGKHVEIKNSP